MKENLERTQEQCEMREYIIENLVQMAHNYRNLSKINRQTLVLHIFGDAPKKIEHRMEYNKAVRDFNKTMRKIVEYNPAEPIENMMNPPIYSDTDSIANGEK